MENAETESVNAIETKDDVGYFIADRLSKSSLKDDIASMEYPFFTLSLKKDMRKLIYRNADGSASVEVQPSAEGLPSIMDKDVLLYAATVVIREINQNRAPKQIIRLSIRDVIVGTRRSVNSDSYKFVKRALNRLTGSMILTNIKTGKKKQGEMFHLLDYAKFVEPTRVSGRDIGLEIKLSDWYYNSLIAKEILTLNRDYFSIKRPIERRIYEIARKHCGRKTKWNIDLEKLRAKSQSTARLTHFRNTIKSLCTEGNLLEYTMKYDPVSQLVSFHHKGMMDQMSLLEESELEENPSTQESLCLPISIPPSLVEDVRRVVGTEFDYYAMWAEYCEWSGSKKADDFKGAFIGFCRNKARKNTRH